MALSLKINKAAGIRVARQGTVRRVVPVRASSAFYDSGEVHFENKDSWPTSAVTLASADDMAHSYNATPEADYNWETKDWPTSAVSLASSDDMVAFYHESKASEEEADPHFESKAEWPASALTLASSEDMASPYHK